jgi:hypothetical protein
MATTNPYIDGLCQQELAARFKDRTFETPVLKPFDVVSLPPAFYPSQSRKANISPLFIALRSEERKTQR